MSSSSGQTVPPGQHPPFATITHQDHTAWILIATALGLAITLLFTSIRIFIRATSHSEYDTDDYLTAVATGLSIVQSSVVFSACAAGLGKSKELLQLDELERVQRLYYASNILYIIPLVLSKAAVAFFLLRLTPIINHRRLIIGLLFGLVIWGVAMLLAMSLVCDLTAPWDLVGKRCHGYFLRWQFLEIIGCLYEAAILAVALWLVWDLKTSFSNKVVVVGTFGFRILLIVIVALRLRSFDEPGLSTDPTLLETRFIVWTSTELNYSIISATIPLLRPFVNNLSTNYGAGQGSSGNGYGGQSSGGYTRTAGRAVHGDSYPMGSLAGSRTRNPEHRSRESEHGGYSSKVVSGSTALEAPNKTDGGDATSLGSNDSQKLIIRKEVTWHVESDRDNDR